MAKKEKGKGKKGEKVEGSPSTPQAVPTHVIAVMFQEGVPQLQTMGDLQTWHFMTAVAFLEGIVLQNTLLKSLQDAKAMEVALQRRVASQAGVVDLADLRRSRDKE